MVTPGPDDVQSEPATASGLGTLEQVLDRMVDGLVAVDPAFRVVAMNRAAEEFLRRAREQLLGRVLWDALPALRGSELEVRSRAAMEDMKPASFEVRSVLRPRWVAVEAYPSAAGLVASFRDVSERHAAEEALRRSENRYRHIFEQTLSGVLVTRPDGTVLEANPAACAILGCTEAEIVRGGRAGVIDLGDPRVPAALDARARDGRFRGQLRLQRRDGTLFEADVASAVFRESEDEPRACVSFTDLTRRTRYEQGLALLADAGAVLGASLDTGRTFRDLAALIVPRLADMCEVDVLDAGVLRPMVLEHRDPALSSLLTSMRAAGAPAPNARISLRVLASNEPVLVPEVSEAWIREMSGASGDLGAMNAVDLRSYLAVPMLAEGQALGVLSLGHATGERRFAPEDVPLVRALADRAALAIQNARLHAAAVRAREVRDELLGMVSHDLRSPLNAINLNLALLARTVQRPELAEMKRSVARANRLIQDLLISTMLDAGALPVEPRPEPVAPVIDEVLQLHHAAAVEARVALECTLAADLPVVPLDRHRLVQLLSNLLSNAIKFTAPGGRVDLRVFCDAEHLHLEVADTGRGIPRAELPKLFDRFWQGAHAHRAGAGLGLAIAKGIAVAHGGELSVESEEGRGSTFAAVIPLRADAPEARR